MHLFFQVYGTPFIQIVSNGETLKQPYRRSCISLCINQEDGLEHFIKKIINAIWLNKMFYIIICMLKTNVKY